MKEEEIQDWEVYSEDNERELIHLDLQEYHY